MPRPCCPSAEVAYPWLLALLATSIFSGLGIARRTLGSGSPPNGQAGPGDRPGDRRDDRRRLDVHGRGRRQRPRPARSAGGLVAVRADRSQSPAAGVLGPIDDRHDRPPSRPDDGSVDGRPIGQIQISGERSGTDLRWTADVATDRALGRFGVARVGARAWLQTPGGAWTGRSRRRRPDELDTQVLAGRCPATCGRRPRTAASSSSREPGPATAGSRSTGRRSSRRFPRSTGSSAQIRSSTGGAELDYWIFSDGEVGQVEWSVSGEAEPLGRGGILGAIEVTLDATERDQFRTIGPPAG